MDVFIGLDVSLASTAICVLGEKGKIVTEAQVASAPDSVVAFMHELPHGIAVIGLEPGPLSQWLHKGLTDAGFDTVLMETRLVAVARILGDGTRRRTSAFTHLQSHYLFRNRLGRPGKGKALVKTARRRFMVPIPKVHDLSVLNERLLARCLERLDALEAGEHPTIGTATKGIGASSLQRPDWPHRDPCRSRLQKRGHTGGHHCEKKNAPGRTAMREIHLWTGAEPDHTDILEPLKHATLVIRDLRGSALWSAHPPRAGWTHELLQQEADRRRPTGRPRPNPPGRRPIQRRAFQDPNTCPSSRSSRYWPQPPYRRQP